MMAAIYFALIVVDERVEILAVVNCGIHHDVNNQVSLVTCCCYYCCSHCHGRKSPSSPLRTRQSSICVTLHNVRLNRIVVGK